MNVVRTATPDDLSLINRLAHAIWWPTYESFLPREQIELMLEDGYAPESLLLQMDSGHQFALIHSLDTQIVFGFVSYRPSEPGVIRIEKLYVLPEFQGKGGGASLIEHVVQQAAVSGCQQLELNVNRHNPSLEFYKKKGFSIYKEVDIPYKEFVLNDYIMRKPL